MHAEGLWPSFRSVVAADEWYFPTLLCLAGLVSLSPLLARSKALRAAEDRCDMYGTKVPPEVKAAADPDAVTTAPDGEGPYIWHINH